MDILSRITKQLDETNARMQTLERDATARDTLNRYCRSGQDSSLSKCNCSSDTGLTKKCINGIVKDCNLKKNEEEEMSKFITDINSCIQDINEQDQPFQEQVLARLATMVQDWGVPRKIVNNRKKLDITQLVKLAALANVLVSR